VIVSDGLETPEIWASRAKTIAGARAHLLVVLVCDEAETDFPFQGRTVFRADATRQPIVVGRAEAARHDYQHAYRAHMAAVCDAIANSGGQIMRHTTADPVLPILLTLAGALHGGALKLGVS
jgi:hypothetical protein